MSITTFKEYQKESLKTAIFPPGRSLEYLFLGICGESGEIAEKAKKAIRDKNGIITGEDKEAMKKELGDVLWYISQIATELDLELEDIANENLIKLFSRLERNKIQGEGDNR